MLQMNRLHRLRAISLTIQLTLLMSVCLLILVPFGHTYFGTLNKDQASGTLPV